MALDTNTYGTVAGVEALIGDLVASRTFTTGTIPTLAQVEAELDNAAMDLNRELEVFGYTVPVDETTYPTAHGFLEAANNYGAAAVILGMLPVASFHPEDDIEGGEISRQKMYGIKFNHALKVIRERKLKAAKDKYRMQGMYAGQRLDSEGQEKKPLFTRDLHEYPGVRGLTKEPD